MNGGLAPSQPTWVAPGTAEALFPISNPGYIFAGWQVGSTTVSTFQPYSAAVNGPTTVTAIFTPAVPVSFVTNPPNLSFYADGVLMSTPVSLDWGLGSSHLISGLNVTEDNTGKRWVFASWNDGGAQTHSYVVGKTLAPETITATVLLYMGSRLDPYHHCHNAAERRAGQRLGIPVMGRSSDECDANFHHSCRGRCQWLPYDGALHTTGQAHGE